jgi:hypothetical protein
MLYPRRGTSGRFKVCDCQAWPCGQGELSADHDLEHRIERLRLAARFANRPAIPTPVRRGYDTSEDVG